MLVWAAAAAAAANAADADAGDAAAGDVDDDSNDHNDDDNDNDVLTKMTMRPTQPPPITMTMMMQSFTRIVPDRPVLHVETCVLAHGRVYVARICESASAGVCTDTRACMCIDMCPDMCTDMCTSMRDQVSPLSVLESSLVNSPVPSQRMYAQCTDSSVGAPVHV